MVPLSWRAGSESWSGSNPEPGSARAQTRLLPLDEAAAASWTRDFDQPTPIAGTVQPSPLAAIAASVLLLNAPSLPDRRVSEDIRIAPTPDSTSTSAEEESSHRDELHSRLSRALQPPIETDLGGYGRLPWPSVLMPFQLVGVQLLLKRDRLLLADEMGLGKTIQVLAAIRLLTFRHEIQSSLVLVPASLVGQWQAQCDRWAPELKVVVVRGPADERPALWGRPAHIHLASLDILRSDLHVLAQRRWDLVVLDEAQAIKNPATDLARAAKSLLRDRAVALTGTPLENRLDDLASILDFVQPRCRDEVPEAFSPAQELRRQLDRVQLRRRKRDVLRDLPPKLSTEVSLPMTPAQRAAYDSAEREGIMELRQLGARIRIQNVLELILRLKQICNFDPVSGSSAKADDLVERIAQVVEAGERALVFSQFQDTQFGAQAIASRLANFKPLVFTGQATALEREAVVRKFQSDPRFPVMVLSLRAGGRGLNLQEASYVFHFDRWWNPAVENQASDRSHRMGQLRPVHVYAYRLEASIEERIGEVLQQKQELFDEVVEGAGISIQQSFSAAELFNLVGLTPPG